MISFNINSTIRYILLRVILILFLLLSFSCIKSHKKQMNVIKGVSKIELSKKYNGNDKLSCDFRSMNIKPYINSFSTRGSLNGFIYQDSNYILWSRCFGFPSREIKEINKYFGKIISSPDGKIFVAINYNVEKTFGDEYIYFINQEMFNAKKFDNKIIDIAFSPSDSAIAYIKENKREVRILNISQNYWFNCRVIRDRDKWIASSSSFITCLSYNKKGDKLAFGDYSGRLYIFESLYQKPKIFGSETISDGIPICKINFLSNNIIVTSNSNNDLNIIVISSNDNYSNLIEKQNYKTFNYHISAVATREKGSLIAVGLSNGEFHLCKYHINNNYIEFLNNKKSNNIINNYNCTDIIKLAFNQKRNSIIIHDETEDLLEVKLSNMIELQTPNSSSNDEEFKFKSTIRCCSWKTIRYILAFSLLIIGFLDMILGYFYSNLGFSIPIGVVLFVLGLIVTLYNCINPKCI